MVAETASCASETAFCARELSTTSALSSATDFDTASRTIEVGLGGASKTISNSRSDWLTLGVVNAPLPLTLHIIALALFLVGRDP